MADEKKTKKSIDQATLQLIEKANKDQVSTVFDRAEKMAACPIGAEGSCCSNCAMGPCRVPLAKGKTETPEDKKKRRGVCGATAETIAARNFVRKIAAGTAAHSDHAGESRKTSWPWRKEIPPALRLKMNRNYCNWRWSLVLKSATAPMKKSPQKSEN